MIRKHLAILSVWIVLSISISLSSSQTSSQDNLDPITNVTKSIFDNEGNMIFTGETRLENINVVKVKPNGETIWEDRFGGTGAEIMEGIVVDSNNDVIALGRTFSSDFPVTENLDQTSFSNFGGKSDLFLRKWNGESGDILWSLYLGGDGLDWVAWFDRGLLLDGQDNLIVSGYTSSSNFPLKNEFQSINKGGEYGGQPEPGDYFISKISSQGEMMWSSYLGGTGGDYLYTFMDSEFNIIIAGGVFSEGYPTTPGSFQEDFPATPGRIPSVISKISPTGELVWSTYSGGSNDDLIGDTIRFNSNNDMFMVVVTDSPDHPVAFNKGGFQEALAGSFDILISKFSKDGDYQWGTYLGGVEREMGPSFCCVDETTDFQYQNQMIRKKIDNRDNLIVMGRTPSVDFPTNNAFQTTPGNTPNSASDLFVAKFTAEGENVFSTFMGGNGAESLGDILVVQNNDIIATGSTRSSVLPFIDSNSFQAEIGGLDDIFVVRMDEDGNLLWSSYYGGSGNDILRYSQVDDEGNLYLIGETSSEDLPGVSESDSFQGGRDGFIVKFDNVGNLVWSSYIGGSGFESFNIYSLLLSPEGQILALGISTSEDFDEIPVSYENGEFGFIVKYNSDGFVLWGQALGIPQAKTEVDDLQNIALVVGTIILIGLILAFMSQKRSNQILLNERMHEILSPVFNSRLSLVYLLLGQSVIKDKDLEDNLKRKIPPEIFDFKEMLHPIRLSISTLLYQNTMITSIDLREELDIPWSELTYHLNTLKKKNFVHVEQKFVDGTMKLVVSPEPKLISQFQKLREYYTAY